MYAKYIVQGTAGLNMMPWHTFYITGLLCGETTSHKWILLTNDQ